MNIPLQREQTEQSAKLDRIMPACAAGAAGRRANWACLCVDARRQGNIGFEGRQEP